MHEYLCVNAVRTRITECKSCLSFLFVLFLLPLLRLALQRDDGGVAHLLYTGLAGRGAAALAAVQRLRHVGTHRLLDLVQVGEPNAAAEHIKECTLQPAEVDEGAGGAGNDDSDLLAIQLKHSVLDVGGAVHLRCESPHSAQRLLLLHCALRMLCLVVGGGAPQYGQRVRTPLHQTGVADDAEVDAAIALHDDHIPGVQRESGEKRLAAVLEGDPDRRPRCECDGLLRCVEGG